MSLFGFKPASLVGLPMARFIDVFQTLSSETEELVTKMIMKVRMGGGLGWELWLNGMLLYVHPPFLHHHVQVTCLPCSHAHLVQLHACSDPLSEAMPPVNMCSGQ